MEAAGAADEDDDLGLLSGAEGADDNDAKADGAEKGPGSHKARK